MHDENNFFAKMFGLTAGLGCLGAILNIAFILAIVYGIFWLFKHFFGA